MKLLLDACVLYPTVIRNLLISVSGKQKWDLIWTEQIFEEWRRASKKINLEAKAQTEAEIAILKSKFPKSMVNDYEKQIPKLYLPDKNDIHVLAAAIEGIGRAGRRAQLIHTGFAAADHPIHLQLLDNSYLKSLVFRL